MPVIVLEARPEASHRMVYVAPLLAVVGTLLGGLPIRINQATRRAKTNDGPSFGGAAPAPSIYGNAGQSVPGLPNAAPPATGLLEQPGGFSAAPGVPPPGDIDVSQVRDDRGNPATKNLFVAGYGQGTTEYQLRDVFGQHAQIIGIIVKGTFSFVNTADRASAVRARQLLSGTVLNGGVLRINFAKESGRLGTSFDVTYNNVGGARGGGGGHAGHYGPR